MLIIHILSVMARDVVLKMRSNVEEKDMQVLHDLSNVALKFDNQMEDKKYIIETEGITAKFNSALDAKEVLKGLSVINNVPKEMEAIVESLKGKKADLVEELKSGAYNFIVFFIDSAEDLNKIRDLNDNGMRYFLSSDKELAKQLGVSFPGVLGYNSVDKNMVRLPFGTQMSSILAAVTLDSFSKLSTISYQKLQQIEQPIYYIIDANQTFEHFYNELGGMCKEFSSECKFLFFKPAEISTLVELLDVKPEDYPLLVYVTREKKNIVRRLNKDNFVENVQNMLNNKLESIKFASKLPEDNDSRGLQVLNTYTIEDFINNDSVDRLVAFTASSCQYCIMMRPEVELLGKELKKKNLPILCGDYNFVENEEVPGIIVDKVPLILFIKKGTKEVIPVDEGVRTFSGLIEYLEKNASFIIKASEYAEMTKPNKEEGFSEKHSKEVEKEGL